MCSENLKGESGPFQRRWVIAGLLVLVGWAVALILYATTPDAADDEEMYDVTHSKTYVREMERIGGKAAVLANDINEWFAGLWEGKTRSYIIAVSSVLVAGAYLFVTRPPRDSSDEPNSRS